MKSINFYIIIASLKPNTVKPVYKGHSREPENVAFMIALYIQLKITCSIHYYKEKQLPVALVYANKL